MPTPPPEPPEQFQPSGSRADATYEKTQSFLQDLQNHANRIRSMCEILANRVGQDDSDTLSRYAARIGIALDSYVNQVMGLAETRLRKEELEVGLDEHQRWHEKYVAGTSNYADFIEYVNRVLRTCQIFLEEYDMLLTAVPLSPDFSQELIESIREELQVKMSRQARAEMAEEQETETAEPEEDDDATG